MVKKKSDKKANNKYSDALALTFEDSIQPRSEKYLAKVGAVLKEWAEKESSLTINQFLALHRIPRKSFHRWVVNNASLAHDYDMAMTALAARREVLGLTKQIDTGMATLSMPMYCTEWKAMREWMAKLKEDAHAGSGKIEIQLTQIPMTAEVTADIERKK